MGIAVTPVVIILLAGCGTDFVEPAPISARPDTPVPNAPVFRIIPATPVATATPLPTAVGPVGSVQRPFPALIDPGRSSTPLASHNVINLWTEYLRDARMIVAGRNIDIHICADGRLIPGSASSIITGGTWGFTASSGEWNEVVFGREFRRGRISGIVTLSRLGASTAAVNDGLSVVSVTDSDLCV